MAPESLIMENSEVFANIGQSYRGGKYSNRQDKAIYGSN